MRNIPIIFAILTTVITVSSCGILDNDSKGETVVAPKSARYERQYGKGKLFGEDFTLFGGKSDSSSSAGASPIGVNAFLWRATLDTLAFMPLTSADPFGGVIITDWYEDPKAKNERFKITAMIMDRTLRADGIKISVFKQVNYNDGTGWRDVEIDPSVARKLENTILTRAKEMKVKSISR